MNHVENVAMKWVYNSIAPTARTQSNMNAKIVILRQMNKSISNVF
jgi:hypothetical protein